MADSTPRLAEREHAEAIAVEALEIVASTPRTKDVYILDEQDMDNVRLALGKMKELQQ